MQPFKTSCVAKLTRQQEQNYIKYEPRNKGKHQQEDQQLTRAAEQLSYEKCGSDCVTVTFYQHRLQARYKDTRRAPLSPEEFTYELTIRKAKAATTTLT